MDFETVLNMVTAFLRREPTVYGTGMCTVVNQETLLLGSERIAEKFPVTTTTTANEIEYLTLNVSGEENM